MTKTKTGKIILVVGGILGAAGLGALGLWWYKNHRKLSSSDWPNFVSWANTNGYGLTLTYFNQWAASIGKDATYADFQAFVAWAKTNGTIKPITGAGGKTIGAGGTNAGGFSRPSALNPSFGG